MSKKFKEIKASVNTQMGNLARNIETTRKNQMENISKIQTSSRTNREKTQIINIRNEAINTTTDCVDRYIKIIKECCKQLSGGLFNNFIEMEQFSSP